MFLCTKITSLFTTFAVASATLHQLFVGTFSSPTLYTLAFDDSALTLNVTKKTTAITNLSTGHSWISFDHEKKNLYAVAGAGVSGYSILSDTSLRLDKTVASGGTCGNVREIFVTAASQPPYAVYTTPFGGNSGCGAVLSVAANGSLSSLIQSYNYSSSSGVHGLAFSPDQKYLYSADDSANSLWAHSIDPTSGKLVQVAKIAGPETGADPRHIAVHSKGAYLYAIFEGTNKVALYQLDKATGIPTFTNTTYPLIPSGTSNANYWSDEVALSPSEKYLWATSRARQNTTKGYISVFSLDPSGNIEKQLFLTPTTSSGGTANAVTPAFFSDEWAALTDSSKGFVQIWRLAANGSQAAPVATANINENGCCANAIWYS